MANRHRGEITARIDGEPRVLCLTLGALAEIEGAFGEDITAFIRRLQEGRVGARDAIVILGAALRGAGASLSNEEVARMHVPGGALGYGRIIVDLLNASFGDLEETGAGNAEAPQGTRIASPGGAVSSCS